MFAAASVVAAPVDTRPGAPPGPVGGPAFAGGAAAALLPVTLSESNEALEVIADRVVHAESILGGLHHEYSFVAAVH